MASVIHQVMEQQAEYTVFHLFPGKPRRDFVYIKDVASATVLAATNDDIPNGSYDVGTGEARLFEDICDIIKIPYTYVDKNLIPKFYQYYTCADTNKFLPGWKPKYNLETGIADYALSKR